MLQEKILTGFIIKQQDLGEADVLLTFFSIELGKIRFLVKSMKKMTSRLSGRLQPNALIKVTLAGHGSLPKLIGVEMLISYSNIFEDQEKIHALLVMQELFQRSLADESPNQELSRIYQNTLVELDQAFAEKTPLILAKFYTQALSALGFAPRVISITTLNSTDQDIYLSFAQGKFTTGFTNSSDRKLSLDAYQLFLECLENKVSNSKYNTAAKELIQILSGFASYQIERELKAVQFFA